MKDKINVELVAQDKVVFNHLKRLLEPTYKVVKQGNGALGDIVLYHLNSKAEPFGVSLKQIKELTGTGKPPVVVVSPDNRLKSSVLRAGAVAFHIFPDEWHDTFLIIRNLYNSWYPLKDKGASAQFGNSATGEDKFLDDVKKSMEKNLANAQYNLAMLCKDVHLSYSQLNRRFKTLKLKPSLYIRSYRLNRALDQLIQGGSSISEISYKVGFNSPAYFTKCFKEEFGILPMEVKKSS